MRRLQRLRRRTWVLILLFVCICVALFGQMGKMGRKDDAQTGQPANTAEPTRRPTVAVLVETATPRPSLTASATATLTPTSTLTPLVVATRTPRPIAPTVAPAANCDPAYPDFCIPPPPPDLDCKDVAPRRNFRVLPPDPHGFDGNDHDGIGCEG